MAFGKWLFSLSMACLRFIQFAVHNSTLFFLTGSTNFYTFCPVNNWVHLWFLVWYMLPWTFVQIFIWMYFFHFVYGPRLGIASIVTLCLDVKELPGCFQSISTIWHPYQECRMVLISPKLPVIFFLHYNQPLVGREWHFIMMLLCIPSS